MESAYIDYKNWCFIVERELGRPFTQDEQKLVVEIGEIGASVASAVGMLKHRQKELSSAARVP